MKKWMQCVVAMATIILVCVPLYAHDAEGGVFLTKEAIEQAASGISDDVEIRRTVGKKAKASVSTRTQPRDPRISQQEILALINMDPVDPNYRTNYDVYDTGVLLVPSPGPTKGKKGWYTNLAVPAGTYMDVPKNSIRTPFTFTAPNGETAEAVSVTVPANTVAVVNACGNEHKPNGPMIMKMTEPRVVTGETRVEYRDRIVEGEERVVYRDREPAPRGQRFWCFRNAANAIVCTVIAGGIVYLATRGGDNSDECKTCPTLPKPPPLLASGRLSFVPAAPLLPSQAEEGEMGLFAPRRGFGMAVKFSFK